MCRALYRKPAAANLGLPSPCPPAVLLHGDRKDPQTRMLVVESNLFEPFEDKSVQEFRHGFWTLAEGWWLSQVNSRQGSWIL